MNLPEKQRLLAARSEDADPKKTIDPREPPVFGDFCSAFAVGPVWVIIELGDFGGRLRPIRIEVRGYASLHDREAYPITPATLRRIQPGHLITLAVRERSGLLQMLMARATRREPSHRRMAELRAERRRVTEAGRSLSSRRGPERREEKDEFWKVIDAYHEACKNESTQPNIDASIAVFGSDRAKWTVRKYVARARKLKILKATERRVPNGEYGRREGKE